MKIAARSQYQAGSAKRNRGMPRSLAAAANTLLAWKIASAVRGMIGENHMCPCHGLELVLERAPIEKLFKLGMPNSGKRAASLGSSSRGKRYEPASLNQAPGIDDKVS